jgi:hypothetical protein
VTQRWHRAELDPDGRVLSCVPVDVAESDGARVIYVTAASESMAVIIAKNAWNALMRPRRSRGRQVSEDGECFSCGHRSDKRARLVVLEEVRDAWRRLPSMGAFTEWLRVQVESAGGRAHRPARGSSSDSALQGQGESPSAGAPGVRGRREPPSDSVEGVEG